jgi:nucleoid DNA-binding protein
MNKEDLINEVNQIVNDKKESGAIVDCVFSSITAALRKNDSVSVSGFGTFKVNRTKARKGRNPRTGEAIEISAKNSPKFKPSKILKEALN